MVLSQDKAGGQHSSLAGLPWAESARRRQMGDWLLGWKLDDHFQPTICQSRVMLKTVIFQSVLYKQGQRGASIKMVEAPAKEGSTAWWPSSETRCVHGQRAWEGPCPWWGTGVILHTPGRFLPGVDREGWGGQDGLAPLLHEGRRPPHRRGFHPGPPRCRLHAALPGYLGTDVQQMPSGGSRQLDR